MSDRPLRKRIPYKKAAELMPAIVDDLAFTKNKCSENARKTNTITELTQFFLWHDKHYHDRDQFGDADGKREGISPDSIESLIRKAIPYLIYYSSIIKGFRFVNYEGNSEPIVRIVLQEDSKETVLNVVLEIHFLNIKEYEVTVKTAMCGVEFRIADGQYALQIFSDGSILKKFENKKLREISSF